MADPTHSDMGFVPDHGQYDRACPNCPDPNDCDLNGDCQLAYFSGREDEDDGCPQCGELHCCEDTHGP